MGSNSGLDFGLGLGGGASTLEDEADHESEFDLNFFLPHEAEMTDPQLDARWSKMEDLVMGMKKAAEEAVRSGEEEGSREGRGRVLGWAEMEEMEEADASFISEGGRGEVGGRRNSLMRRRIKNKKEEKKGVPWDLRIEDGQ